MRGDDASMESAGDGGAQAVEATLVEIEPAVAVVFGEHPPAGLSLEPLALLDEPLRASLGNSLGPLIGVGDVGAQAVQAGTQVQGIVRLAPETVKALQTAKPMVSGGWNAGVLRDSSGRIVLASFTRLPTDELPRSALPRVDEAMSDGQQTEASKKERGTSS